MTRPYDNTLRRERASDTRQRIVDAGCDVLHDSDVRDWRGLTIVAVAERAGVSERTVYRHFGTEQRLRDAVMGAMEARAGIDLDRLRLDEVAAAATRIFDQVAGFPPSPQPSLDSVLSGTHRRQRSALIGAVSAVGAHMDEGERVKVAAVLDVLWSVAAYERLAAGWNLGSEEASRTLSWAIDVIASTVTMADQA